MSLAAILSFSSAVVTDSFWPGTLTDLQSITVLMSLPKPLLRLLPPISAVTQVRNKEEAKITIHPLILLLALLQPN